ncbi:MULTISPECIES: hypothetical protein [Halorubrum]|uniref:hypothetical protein n=1 Tax=Halorubrum TaxID=56688 RepID=UPI0012673232|nr:MULTISPECIES: hypothetical protein [Halorubrum]
MVEFRSSAKLILFTSSYAPLLVIVGIKLWSRPPVALENITARGYVFEINISWITVATLLSAVILYVFLWYVIQKHRKLKTTGINVNHYRQRNELLSSYLLVYVFAFVSLDASTVQGTAILSFFLAILAVIQLNSEMLHINPLLGLMGYRVYEIESDISTVLVISDVDISKRLKQPESVSNENQYRIDTISMGQNTYLIPPEND